MKTVGIFIEYTHEDLKHLSDKGVNTLVDPDGKKYTIEKRASDYTFALWSEDNTPTMRIRTGAYSVYRGFGPHAICDDCWIDVRGGAIPYRVKKPKTVVCCWCRKKTNSGIFMRADPDAENLRCQCGRKGE
jgi:hypothetical protein